MTDKLNDNDKQRIEQEALEALWEKMSHEDWIAGKGFRGKVGGLSGIPIICKERIFEFAKEYATRYEREKEGERCPSLPECYAASKKLDKLEAERSELAREAYAAGIYRASNAEDSETFEDFMKRKLP